VFRAVRAPYPSGDSSPPSFASQRRWSCIQFFPIPSGFSIPWRFSSIWICDFTPVDFSAKSNLARTASRSSRV